MRNTKPKTLVGLNERLGRSYAFLKACGATAVLKGASSNWIYDDEH